MLVVMQHGDLPIYSIGAVERMLDIPTATIRNWEERYGLVKPERKATAATGLYTRAQVEQLRFVIEGRLAGYSRPRPIACLLSSLERGSGYRSPDERGRRLASLILLAERDPYAAEFRRVLPPDRGLRGCSRPRYR